MFPICIIISELVFIDSVGIIVTLTVLFVFLGFYMYIETSRPRKEDEKARLVSPFFNVAPKNPYVITNPPAYCFGFFYHMYGKHIGKTHSSFPHCPQSIQHVCVWV